MKFDNHVIIVSQFLGPIAELIKEMVDVEVNNSNVSAIVDTLIKKM